MARRPAKPRIKKKPTRRLPGARKVVTVRVHSRGARGPGQNPRVAVRAYKRRAPR